MHELLNLKKYFVITFNSTSHALKAERIMKGKQQEILLTPTLREISSSCGLSLKFKPEMLELIYRELLKNNVAVDEIYAVETINKKNIVTKIEPSEM